MARARNIKPGFFKNEDLAECSPFARLCFAGLWTMADREGRLEDRPKRIKGELFPYDNVDVDPLLEELAHWGFIRRYQVAGERFIFIVKFVEHQVPHGTEKDGSAPDENGFLTVHERRSNGYITGKVRLEPHHLTVKTPGLDDGPAESLTVKTPSPEGGQNTLNPDSGFLIPESPILNPDSLRPVVEAVGPVEPKPTAARSAKRCPESFTVGPDLLQWAADKVPAMNAEALRYETEKFRDHTFATARTDWPATWRAWMRKANEDRQKRSGSGANAPEPAWRTERQNRMAQAAPYAVAARPARRPFNPDDEATDVLPLSRPIA